MNKVVLLGECMVELINAGENLLQRSFAGDVYNMAVYLKRTNADVKTSMFSAVGKDELSEQMLERFASESVDSDYVFRSEDRNPGMYLVQTDAEGERSFSYWRSQSAARHVMRLMPDNIVDQLADTDYLFFSGISLAVIEPEDRPLLWDLLTKIRARGVKVIFDPNYRPRLWGADEDVKGQFKTAIEHCDILMPGIEDFDWLFGLDNVDDIHEYCSQFGINEVILKNGPKDVYCLQANGERIHVPITAAKTVVDTTSAGDSFNGSYLAARISGKDIPEAVTIASKVAAEVIQHRGAIVPKPIFDEFFNKLTAG